MLHTQTGYSGDKLHDKSRNTDRNINTAHDVIFDIIKPNDTRKFTKISSAYFLFILFY